MKSIRPFLLLLALCLVLGAVSCTEQTPSTGDPADSTNGAELSTEGLSEPVRYAEAALPSIDDLTQWFARAVDREQLTNAMIYSQEGNLWHCWLYVGSYADGDRVTVETDGERLVLRANVADPLVSGSRSALYFTFSCETEPDAVIEINGEEEGILLTFADTSLRP